MILRGIVLARDKFTCRKCGVKGKDIILECDHVIPLADGGSNDLDNLQTLCVKCHDVKSYGHITDRPTTFSQRRAMQSKQNPRVSS